MNKYIKSDIHNGLVYLKCAIMNIFHALETKEINEYVLNSISFYYIIKCAKERGWEEDLMPDDEYHMIFPNKDIYLTIYTYEDNVKLITTYE